MRPGKSYEWSVRGQRWGRRGKYLWLVAAELPVAVCQSLQANGELDVTATDDVLDFEFRKLRLKPKLLHNAGVFAGRKARVVLGLCTGDDHLARGEDESGRLWVADTHDDSCKTLITRETTVRRAITLKAWYGTNLGIVLCIPRVEGDSFEVEAAVEVDGGYDVLEGGHDALDGGDVLLLEGEGYGS
jgi:hypothetical protein